MHMKTPIFKVLLFALLSGVTLHAWALSPADLALLDRITYGATQQDIAAMERMGREAYLREQLRYHGDENLPAAAKAAIAELRISREGMPDFVDQMREMRMSTRNDEAKRKEARQTLRKDFNELDVEAFQRRSLRALHSPDQLQEMLTWFWFNHFNVFQRKGPVRFMVADYEEQAIRPHVLGNFRDLVRATLRHPAMLFYLDNAKNTRDKLNENYARELMELHTMGVGSGYTQADVQALARILTGATIDYSGKSGPALFVFAPQLHDNGPKDFLGRRIEGSNTFAEIDQALDILTKHPATARFISTKLAVYFYGDEPPESLVERMARRFSATDGDIAATLYAMLDSPEFADATKLPPKFKDPVQYVYSSLRAAYPGSMPITFVPLNRALNEMGEPVYGHQTPDGYGMRQKDWASAAQLEKRFEFAGALAKGGSRLFRDGERIDVTGMKAYAARRYSANTQKTLQQTRNEAEWVSLFLSAPEFMYR